MKPKRYPSLWILAIALLLAICFILTICFLLIKYKEVLQVDRTHQSIYVVKSPTSNSCYLINMNEMKLIGDSHGVGFHNIDCPQSDKIYNDDHLLWSSIYHPAAEIDAQDYCWEIVTLNQKISYIGISSVKCEHLPKE